MSKIKARAPRKETTGDTLPLEAPAMKPGPAAVGEGTVTLVLKPDEPPVLSGLELLMVEPLPLPEEPAGVETAAAPKEVGVTVITV